MPEVTSDVRRDIKDKVKLSQSFLSEYEGKHPNWGFDGLGYIVYLRTYSRKKADGTLESWDETVRRFTEGNFRIEAERLYELGKLTDDAVASLNDEMERLYHLAFNLVALPPGRGIWMSGTEYAERVGDAENNCWGVSMRPQEYFPGDKDPKVSFAPVFTFDQAMKGGGVGVNVQRKYVQQIPAVTNKVDLRFICDTGHSDYQELKKLGVLAVEATNPGEYKRCIVDDSREGWAESLAAVIDSHYQSHYTNTGADLLKLEIDVSEVRPLGSDIRGFGGTASGPKPLIEMLRKVNEILNHRSNQFVSPTEWGDIIQNIGCCVVAGNVRRTALILIGDEGDKQFVNSKNYSLPENKEPSLWRWASNNSVDISPTTSRDTLHGVACNIYYNGEPGYTNIDLAKNFGRVIDGFQEDIDGEVEVFNPCGEISLPNGSPCNLFEVNLPRIREWIDSGLATEDLYQEAFALAARYAYRVTFRHYEWAVTREVVYRHRRLGVGITGITDWVLMSFNKNAILGYDENDDPIYETRVTDALDRFYGFVRDANEKQARELESSVSIKVTTVKPSGTVSLLMGVSPGQHFHWSAWMIRRIRIGSDAPLVPVLRKCGYTIEESIKGYKDDGTPVYDPRTLVVEFPVKAATAGNEYFRSAGDVSLKDQFALQSMLATYWADNAVSATLSFRKPEPKPVYFSDGVMLLDKFGNPKLEVHPAEEESVIREITDLLDKYKNKIKSTTLLPYATGTYPQMPYESITEQKYHEMVAQIKYRPWEIMDGSVLAEEDEVEDTSSECAAGFCPIK